MIKMQNKGNVISFEFTKYEVQSNYGILQKDTNQTEYVQTYVVPTLLYNINNLRFLHHFLVMKKLLHCDGATTLSMFSKSKVRDVS